MKTWDRGPTSPQTISGDLVAITWPVQPPIRGLIREKGKKLRPGSPKRKCSSMGSRRCSPSWKGLKFKTQKGEKRLKLPTRMLISRSVGRRSFPPLSNEMKISTANVLTFSLRHSGCKNLFPPSLPTSELMQIFSLKFSFHFFIVVRERVERCGKGKGEGFLLLDWFICARYRDGKIFEFSINAEFTPPSASSARRKRFN